jgi:outer membrane immunogenic protein
MKNNLLSGVAILAGLTLFGGQGNAADLPAKAPRMIPPAPLSTWSGLYIGGHAMYGESGYSTDYFSPSGSGKKNYSATTDISGLGVGLHAGYNWQASQWVFGLEGDVTMTAWENSGQVYVSPSGKKSHDVNGRIGSLSSIRGRLGIAFDSTLLYATGGVAFAEGSYENVQNEDKKGPVTFGGKSKFEVGAVVGGGIEWKYTSNMSIRLEGLYYFFDKDNTEIVKEGKKGNTTLTHSLQDISVVRVGANWHF